MAKISRRRFLIRTGSAAILTLYSGHLIIEKYNMKKAPGKPGKIIADFHTHPNKNEPVSKILETLSQGITGLAAINNSKNILTYDDVIQLSNSKELEITEIDSGLFARIRYKNNTGYIFRTQEVMSDHHILAVGVRHQIPDYPDSRKTVERIHELRGIAVADHPYVVPTGRSVIRYRLINSQEEKKIKELHQMIDESEVFNGQCINLVPFIAWMKQANKKAIKLASEYGFNGTASSDAHSVLEQIHTCGIYLPDDTTCIEALKENVKSGNFQRYEKYVSKLSFLEGHFFS